jgi:hypothetical protein
MIKIKNKAIKTIGNILITGIILTSTTACSIPFLNQQPTNGVTESTVKMTLGAENSLANDSLKMKILNIQRRPTSTFTNNTTTSNDTNTTNNDIAIEIDVSYTYNENTLQSVATEHGTEPNTDTASTLKELLLPGTLMYLQGEDANGGTYKSSEILTLDNKNQNANTTGINTKWDYDLINSPVPVASEEKKGSIIMKASSTAKNLKLVITTAHNNPSPLEPESVLKGGNTTYLLDLENPSNK